MDCVYVWFTSAAGAENIYVQLVSHYSTRIWRGGTNVSGWLRTVPHKFLVWIKLGSKRAVSLFPPSNLVCGEESHPTTGDIVGAEQSIYFLDGGQQCLTAAT